MVADNIDELEKLPWGSATGIDVPRLLRLIDASDNKGADSASLELSNAWTYGAQDLTPNAPAMVAILTAYLVAPSTKHPERYLSTLASIGDCAVLFDKPMTVRCPETHAQETIDELRERCEFYKPYLDAPDPVVRDDAAVILGATMDQRAIVPLAARLDIESDAGVWATLVLSLVFLRADIAEPLCREALGSEETVHWFVGALGLVRLLRDKAPITALQRLTDAIVNPTLIESVSKARPYLKKYDARNALACLERNVKIPCLERMIDALSSAEGRDARFLADTLLWLTMHTTGWPPTTKDRSELDDIQMDVLRAISKMSEDFWKDRFYSPAGALHAYGLPDTKSELESFIRDS